MPLSVRASADERALGEQTLDEVEAADGQCETAQEES
jgi:hypothetical protein